MGMINLKSEIMMILGDEENRIREGFRRGFKDILKTYKKANMAK